MIKLKNVSKFYYSKGLIATGFSKVSLDFKIGEFIAITGESGSGKSTLLNVISGLDSYEEGEMYVNGQETSHYIEKDWEDYRRKYIGNIYQSFNLITSYTVYQNVELVLILNGLSKKEAKPKVLELLKKVGLEKFKNTKVSKLSGGQKQRVSIARALAKDVPIIIADEPTGNLDKRSAESIIKLLSEIAKDHLVIIVTHNYEQVEEYATRKITMHDGKVLEDKILKETVKQKALENNYKNITFLNKIRLSIRNTFNIIPKFILLFAVYLFLIASLVSEYSAFRKEEYQTSKYGNNYLFQDLSDTRIIIRKSDRSPITEDDYNAISKLSNIDYIMKSDLIIEQYTTVETADHSLVVGGNVKNITQLKTTPDKGRLPENENEIVVSGSKDDYYLSDRYDLLLNSDFYLSNDYGSTNIEKIKIVGIKYYEDDVYRDYELYLSDKLINELQYYINEDYSGIKVNFMGTNYQSYSYQNDFKIVPSKNVPANEAYISEDYNAYCDKYNCLNKTFSIKVKNIYYEDTITPKITKTYNKNNINQILGIGKVSDEEYLSEYNGNIFINFDDYHNLFNKDNYQSSIYIKDVQMIDKTVSFLKELGYDVLPIKDVIVTSGATQALRIVKIIVTIIFVITLFFISYFIIKLILKSRNIYFSTIRMLGASKKVCRQLLINELLIITNLAYLTFLVLTLLNRMELVNINFINTVNTYFHFNDYILMYIVITIMSLLISEKYAAKLYKTAAMNAYREEV